MPRIPKKPKNNANAGANANANAGQAAAANPNVEPAAPPVNPEQNGDGQDGQIQEELAEQQFPDVDQGPVPMQEDDNGSVISNDADGKQPGEVAEPPQAAPAGLALPKAKPVAGPKLEDPLRATKMKATEKQLPVLEAGAQDVQEHLRKALQITAQIAFATPQTEVEYYLRTLTFTLVNHPAIHQHIKQTVWAEFLAGEIANIEEAKLRVHTFFGEHHVERDVVSTLKQMRQGNRTPSAHAEAFRQLFHNSSLAESSRERELAEDLIASFTEASLRQHLAVIGCLYDMARKDTFDLDPFTIDGLVEIVRGLEKSKHFGAPAVSQTGMAAAPSSFAAGAVAGISASRRAPNRPLDPEAALKFCNEHQRYGHTDSECREVDRKRRAQALAVPNVLATPLPTVAAAASASALPVPQPKRQKRDKADITCFACGAKGHFASECPTKGPPPPGAGAAGSKKGRNTLKLSTLLQSDDQKLIVPLLQTLAQQKQFEYNISVDAASSTRTRIALNDVAIDAIVDSGASGSFISQHELKERGLELVPSNNVSAEVFNGMQIPCLGFSPIVVLNYIDKVCLTKLIVVDKLKHAQMILGLNDAKRLGLLREQELDNPLVDDVKQHSASTQKALELTDIRDEEATPSPSDADVSLEEQRQVTEAIQELLEANQKLTGFAKVNPVQLQLKSRVPIRQKQYGLPEAVRPAVDAQIEKWIKAGRIAPGNSPWNLPITTAPKNDINGARCGTRVCFDTRVINDLLVDEAFPIPHVTEVVDGLKGNTIFSEVDLEDSFLQLPLAVVDQQVMAFTWRGIQYTFLGTPYGLKTMSQVFQRIVSTIFHDMPFVHPYIDNLNIASKDLNEHITHVRMVMQRLNEYNIRISPKKLKLARRSITTLGHQVSAAGIAPDPRKIAKILNWPFPQSCSALQSFLGCVNFLRRHIRHAAELCAILNKARNTEEDFLREMKQNGDGMRDAFTRLKEAISRLPMLVFSDPDPKRRLHVATDASTSGIGAVLYQPTHEQVAAGNSDVTPDNIVSMTSRSLQPHERNYPTFKLEALAVVNAVDEFHEHLYGRKFVLHTDHKALTSLRKYSKQQRTLGSWVLKLMEYDFTVVHIEGPDNILPDHLSRLYHGTPVWGVATSANTHDNEAISEPVIVPLLRTEIHTKPSDFDERSEIMLLTGRTIPDEAERKGIIERAHQRGHFGEKALATAIFQEEKLWWPSLGSDIRAMVAGCEVCQRWNIAKDGYHPLSSPNSMLPGQWMQIDLIEMPTSSEGHKYIMLLIDIFSGFCIARALYTKTAKEVAAALHEIFCTIGAPETLQSDEGAEFTNAVLDALRQFHGFTHHVSTAHSHRSKGVVERANRTIEAILHKLLDGAITGWHMLLPWSIWTYNTTPRTATQTTPFSIMFLRSHIRAPSDIDPDTDFDITSWLENKGHALSVVYPELRGLMDKARETMSQQYARSHRITERLPVNSYVMAKDTGRTSKHEPAYIGPFQIASITKTGAYELVKGDYRITRARDQLKPIPPPAETKETSSEEKLWTVDHIVAHRGSPAKPAAMTFLVKWKGFEEKSNSWEPVSSFVDKKVVSTYLKSLTPTTATKRVASTGRSVSTKRRRRK